MKIGTWLLSLVQPMIGRILAAIGFSVVTITGFQVAVATLKTQLVNSVTSLPSDLLNLFLISGCGEGLGMITGAIAVRVLLWQIQQGTKLLGVNPQ